MGHTPGPWKTTPQTFSPSIWIERQDAGNDEAAIASVRSRDDARLIAAAPELLEALSEVMALLRKEAPGTPLNNHRFDALGIKAYAAISKAAS